MKNINLVLGKHKVDKRTTAITFISIVLITVAGLRYQVGTDYGTYVQNYDGYKELDISNFGVRFFANVAKYIHDDYSTWFFLMALFTVGLCMLAIKKHSSIWQLSIILYLFMGYWHTSFNIVKQCAAMALLIAFQEFLYEKKFWKWLIVCAVASLFHITALFMIPIYFFVIREVNIKQITLLVLVGVLVGIGYEALFQIMSFLKDNVGTESITSAVGAREVNLLRTLVNVAPISLLAFLIKDFDNEDMSLRVSTNFSLFNAILSVATSNSVYLSRFCYYIGIFNIFFIPNIVKRIGKNNARIVCAILVISYFFFWIYDLSKGSSTVDFHWIFER